MIFWPSVSKNPFMGTGTREHIKAPIPQILLHIHKLIIEFNILMYYYIFSKYPSFFREINMGLQFKFFLCKSSVCINKILGLTLQNKQTKNGFLHADLQIVGTRQCWHCFFFSFFLCAISILTSFLYFSTPW